MRKLIASTFASPDRVMQAPGGPTEDPTGNFTLGGWLFAFETQGWIFLRQVPMVRNRHCTGSQNLRNIRGILALPIRGSFDCEDAQCGKKACGVPHFEVVAMEQFVGN